MSTPPQDSSESEFTVPGRRTLAAIVFTDAVGFSALAGTDEHAALRLIESDSRLIRSLCESFNGKCIKSTGDGLLMLFASAVDAVRFILACRVQLDQRDGEGHLQHRIGAHLGDVVIHNEDVLGDGVNVAARLQQIATPDSAYISSTLLQMVRGKLFFESRLVGTRDLKNISQPVTIYSIHAGTEVGSIQITPIARRLTLWGFPLALMLATFVVGFIIWRSRPVPRIQALSQPSMVRAIKTPAASIDQEITQYKSSYDFESIVALLGSEQAVQSGATSEDTFVYASLVDFRQWIEKRLSIASEHSPIHGEGKWEGRSRVLDAWMESGQVVIVENGARQTMKLANLPPWQLRLLASAAAASDTHANSAEILDWIVSFSEVYDLPFPEPTKSR